MEVVLELEQFLQSQEKRKKELDKVLKNSETRFETQSQRWRYLLAGTGTESNDCGLSEEWSNATSDNARQQPLPRTAFVEYGVSGGVDTTTRSNHINELSCSPPSSTRKAERTWRIDPRQNRRPCTPSGTLGYCSLSPGAVQFFFEDDLSPSESEPSEVPFRSRLTARSPSSSSRGGGAVVGEVHTVQGGRPGVRRKRPGTSSGRLRQPGRGPSSSPAFVEDKNSARFISCAVDGFAGTDSPSKAFPRPKTTNVADGAHARSQSSEKERYALDSFRFSNKGRRQRGVRPNSAAPSCSKGRRPKRKKKVRGGAEMSFSLAKESVLDQARERKVSFWNECIEKTCLATSHQKLAAERATTFMREERIQREQKLSIEEETKKTIESRLQALELKRKEILLSSLPSPRKKSGRGESDRQYGVAAKKNTTRTGEETRVSINEHRNSGENLNEQGERVAQDLRVEMKDTHQYLSRSGNNNFPATTNGTVVGPNCASAPEEPEFDRPTHLRDEEKVQRMDPKDLKGSLIKGTVEAALERTFESLTVMGKLGSKGGSAVMARMEDDERRRNLQLLRILRLKAIAAYRDKLKVEIEKEEVEAKRISDERRRLEEDLLTDNA